MNYLQRCQGPKDKDTRRLCYHAEEIYIDQEGCLNWIKTNFPLRTKEEPRRLLAWNSCATHLTGKVRAEPNERNIDVVVIIGGLTSLVQPFHVAVNKPMKDNMKKLWSTWMESGKGEYNNQGKKAPYERASHHMGRESLG